MIKDTTQHHQSHSALPGLERRTEPQLPAGVPAMLVRTNDERLVMLTNPTIDQDTVEDCMALLCSEIVRMLDEQGRSATAVAHHHDGITLLEVPLSPRVALAGQVTR